MNDAASSRPGDFESEKHAAIRGLVGVCPRKLERVLVSKNLNLTSISQGAELSRGWLIKLKKGKPVLRNKLEEFCDFLKVAVESLLPDVAAEAAEHDFAYPAPSGWKITEYIGPTRIAANKLSYRVVKLNHQYIAEKVARGKFYDLIHVAKSRRAEFIDHLTRHARVCERVGKHPNIAENLDVHPVLNQDGWWVLDKWVSGKSLEEQIEEGQTHGVESIRVIGQGILDGLTALHQKQVYFRELSPDKVYICDEGSRVILTDFEMAKLADGSPSVSHRWEMGFFRAPELGDYDASPAVDLYSFGRILLWLLNDGNMKKKQLSKSDHIPAGILGAIKACLEPRPSKRPPSVDTVRNIWTTWK